MVNLLGEDLWIKTKGHRFKPTTWIPFIRVDIFEIIEFNNRDHFEI